MSMSKADEFRQSTAEFWSKMDQKVGSVAARRKLAPARSGKTAAGSMPRARAAATAPKTKKRSQALIGLARDTRRGARFGAIKSV